MNYTNKKKIISKQGLQDILNQKILPYFKFQNEWNFSEDGQLKLEQARYGELQPYMFGMRQFAAKYTKNIRLFKHYDRLFEFVDKQFFNSVLLYGCLCIIYTKIRENNGYILATEVEDQLRYFIDIALKKYLKKEKKKKYLKLTKVERRNLEEDILHVIWDNFKKLKIITYTFRRDSNYVVAHPEFDYQMFEDSFKPWLYDLPCIKTPINWELNETGTLENGGYHLYKKNFLLQKTEFTGNVKFENKFKDVINKLQHISWTIDHNFILYLKEDFHKLFEKLEKNKKIEFPDKEDTFQSLNTYLFITKFFELFPKFYFSYSADARGRLYPQCHWAFAPSSSKIIRKILRLTEEIPLTEEGKDYLYMKIGLLYGYDNKINSQLLNETKKNINIILDQHKSKLTYTSFMIIEIYNDIIRGKTRHIIQNDATCSAFQMIAIIKNDKKLMELTNLIGINSEITGPNSPFIRKDLYTYILNLCEKNVPHNLMSVFLIRDIMKTLIMPKAYGKTDYRSIQDLTKFLDLEENFLTRKEILNLDDEILLTNISNYHRETLNTKRQKSTQDYEWEKLKIFCIWFYNYFDNIFNLEFPDLKEFMDLWLNNDSPLAQFSHTTEYMTFNNVYNKSNLYKLTKEKKDIKIKKSSLSFFRLTDEIDYSQTAQSALANYVHGLDAFNCHFIINNWPDNININTNHDCIITSPNEGVLANLMYKEGCIKIQEYVKKIPEIAKYHQNGSIPITSNNMLKFS